MGSCTIHVRVVGVLPRVCLALTLNSLKQPNVPCSQLLIHYRSVCVCVSARVDPASKEVEKEMEGVFCVFWCG